VVVSLGRFGRVRWFWAGLVIFKDGRFKQFDPFSPMSHSGGDFWLFLVLCAEFRPFWANLMTFTDFGCFADFWWYRAFVMKSGGFGAFW